MVKKPRTRVFTIRFPEDIFDWCRKRAQKRRVPVAIIVRDCVLTAMESESTS